MKKQLCMYFLFTFFCLIKSEVLSYEGINSEGVTESYVKKMLTTKNVQILIQKKKERHKWLLSVKKCRLQIKKNQLPWSCYEALFLQGKFKKRSLKMEKLLIRRFDHYCRTSLREIKFLRELAGNLNDEISGTETCRSLVSEKKEELLYRKYGRM